ncbi:MspA family porin [Mycobacterium sp. NBC_00419]|uniref:MspA family porin n=1 Tax=Mycobacterium sp. NBC_00419 TaxID=2975989 RepID=UPI003FA54947
MALAGCFLAVAVAPASADPDPAAPDAQPVAAAAPDPAAAPPVDDGRVESTPPAVTKSPDGWTLTVSAKDEVQMPSAPLTTAISSREYVVGGVYNGALSGDGSTPKGVFEVGYQIGCGIDMSTSNGVSLTGTAGINPSIGYTGFDFPGTVPDGLLPGIGANIGGGITVGLKPGIINVVPVTKKEYKGAAPWVSISNFHVKIDGCVGESFIRSYATLTKSTDEGDAILSWYGVTKKI